jgi:copper homeostasis protein
MLQDVQFCRQLNCKGVVLGLLLRDGNIDVRRTAHLVQAAGPMAVSFHRAFDRAANPLQALEDVIATGCTRLLTSGQERTATEGKQLIKQLVEQAASRIIIMPGSGVRSNNVEALAKYTRAAEFHSSARIPVPSAMKFESEIFEAEPGNVGIDSTEIERMKTILKTAYG